MIDDDAFDFASIFKSHYKEFARTHKGLIKIYGTTIMRTAYDEIVEYLSSTDDTAIPIEKISEIINARLCEKNIQVFNPEEIIDSIMTFLEPFFGFTKDSFENHRKEGSKITWAVLARYVKNPVHYTADLFDEIITYFSRNRDVSVAETARFIASQHAFAMLPEEAVEEVVEALFDYFVKKGNISLK